tara:strand:+ start:381 stop:644 length:264 start_codon:yes stop_codon:yes gene_type:complete
MAITKETNIEFYKISVEDKTIELIESVAIKEDGNILSSTNYRRTLSPTDDISNESDGLKTIAEFLWTNEVKQSWIDKMAVVNKGTSI